ncbi:MAG: diguanylate cyclase, partial [Desulfohalobiaceae bacterium]|nr:diguanylate cyclase [Desulfohalobiaceae bacterium]
FVFRDVTEAYRQEEALRESQRSMQTLLSNLPGMAYRCSNSPERAMEFVSQGCEELLECSAQDLTSSWGVNYGDLINTRDIFSVQVQIREAINQNRAFRLEYRVTTQSGQQKWVWEQGRVVEANERGKEVLEGFITDITEHKSFQERLNYLSFHDSLTGLYNRNFFEEEMNRLGDGRHTPVGILICDLDGLKFVNDTLGHQSGDEMLMNIAGLLRDNFRSSDILARIGGDEYAILLTETTQQEVEHMTRRLKRSIEEYNKQKPRIPLSLSMGHAVTETGPADMQALFREADNRMYREKIQRESSARNSAVQALIRAMEARDLLTEGHCHQLQHQVAALGRAMGLAEDRINDLVLFARFHDLGKVGVPDRILFKPGPLTEEEMRKMRKHSETGCRIAQSVPDLAPIAEWILKHHERWDGRGYPQGLQGEEIPLCCRILAVADAFDAMISDRPYRRAMSREAAIDELQRHAGTQFDPTVVARFLELLRDGVDSR